MLKDMLTLSGVQVAKEVVTPNGLGGSTTTTTLTTLSRCQIYQAGGSNRYISDKMAKASTHVLVIEPGTYSFTDDDHYIINGSNKYKLTGHVDDVVHQGLICTIGLEKIT